MCTWAEKRSNIYTNALVNSQSEVEYKTLHNILLFMDSLFSKLVLRFSISSEMSGKLKNSWQSDIMSGEEAVLKCEEFPEWYVIHGLCDGVLCLCCYSLADLARFFGCQPPPFTFPSSPSSLALSFSLSLPWNPFLPLLPVPSLFPPLHWNSAMHCKLLQWAPRWSPAAKAVLSRGIVPGGNDFASF